MITAQHGPQPADFADVRATNLAVVLRHVRRHAPCSRADIAAATGLNKATVSSLVADLIERRLVRESGLTEHRIGRPATMLVLDGTAYAGLGVTVATDQVTAVALDLAGEQLLSWRRAVTPGGAQNGVATTSPGRLTSAVTTVVGRAVNRLTAAGRQVLKLTVGVPGLVDADGTVRLASDLGWHDVDLRGELVRALRKPGYDVVVENDANLAVLAEFRFGAHAATANLIHVTNAAGVGAGIILDGRLVRGGLGYSGEIGHITVEPDGPACPCGRRGCLEAVAGAAAIVRHVRPQPDDAAVPDLAAEVEEVVRRARRADRTTLDVLNRAGRHVGRALASTVNLLNPEVVALGGHYVALAPWLLPAAEEELAAGSVAPGAGGCRLVASALGADAAAIGGAARLLDDLDGGLLPRPAGG
ncbi:ROK family transcriptional regulator [Virgisporangium ochraceum]|uniref:Xylose repressor n=1 Tax=Virgisporangium ochraceum TaxID=65505 RepID=A0A8J3ZPG9_9ACTN|nr:ROK family transcriptional regulator [Virgisporangium ochraceum]GIJ67559.1 xylose repressor [Virgisporangium ochraceum]